MNKTLKKNSKGHLEMYCPECREKLDCADVENFHVCPFCGSNCNSDEVEDFVLDPIIRNWLRKNPLAQ